MLAAMIGTPVHSSCEFLNTYVRLKLTCDLLFNVDLFGRISTSLKSNLMSSSILGIVDHDQSITKYDDFKKKSNGFHVCLQSKKIHVFRCLNELFQNLFMKDELV